MLENKDFRLLVRKTYQSYLYGGDDFTHDFNKLLLKTHRSYKYLTDCQKEYNEAVKKVQKYLNIENLPKNMGSDLKKKHEIPLTMMHTSEIRKINANQCKLKKQKLKEAASMYNEAFNKLKTWIEQNYDKHNNVEDSGIFSKEYVYHGWKQSLCNKPVLMAESVNKLKSYVKNRKRQFIKALEMNCDTADKLYFYYDPNLEVKFAALEGKDIERFVGCSCIWVDDKTLPQYWNTEDKYRVKE